MDDLLKRLIKQAVSHTSSGVTRLLIAGSLGMAAGTAQATLGEPSSSIQRDQTTLGGQALVVTPRVGFTQHEFTLPSGVRMTQYAAPGGVVFALSWSGPVKPDLQVVLGAHHATYLKATESLVGIQRTLSVNTDHLVLHMNALPRGFAGMAYLDNQLPAGVSLQDLQ